MEQEKAAIDRIILSIGDAHMLAPRRINNQEDRTLLVQIYKAAMHDDITGDNSDFHNLAATYAKHNDFGAAFEIVKKGLLQYPYDIDLLADGIKYGANCNQIAECEKMLDTLFKRPFAFWNWRTFTFAVDYLLLSLNWEAPENAAPVLKKALDISKKFQETLPSEERGYVCEADVYICQSRIDEAKKVLHHAIFEIPNLIMPQCCIKYADILLEIGDFETAINVAEKGLMVSAQQQPTARTGYFSYISALSKDALIHQQNAFGDESRIRDTYNDYLVANRLLTANPIYIENIKTRTSILSVKSGVPFEGENSDEIKDILRMMERIKK